MSKKDRNTRGPLTPKRGSQSGVIVSQHGEKLSFLHYSKDESAAKHRMAILYRNRERIEHEAVQSKAKGLTDFAFVINELTEDDKLSPDVLAFVRQSKANRCTPTQVSEMPRIALLASLRQLQLRLHQVDARNPMFSPIVEALAQPAQPNFFWVIVVTRNGKQATQMPMPT